MKSKYLIWVDIETTGLEPNKDSILEIAIVVTAADRHLTQVDEISKTIYHLPEVLNMMGEWCMNQHTKSGLVSKKGLNGELCVSGGQRQGWMEAELIEFVKRYLCTRRVKSHMCGSSVHFDRAFIKEHMPQLESCFHYRNLDVSSIKKFMDMAGYESSPVNVNQCTHRALNDIKDSIEYLREHFRDLYI